MFFVDDDEPDTVQRREHRRPRADDDVHCTAADALPLIVPFAGGQAAVLNGDTVAELVTKRASDGGRQCNFGHQDQRRAIVTADGRREAEVDFGLAAAGHAVQQRDAEFPGVGDGVQAVQGIGLLGGQFSVVSSLRPCSVPTPSLLRPRCVPTPSLLRPH